MRRLASPNLDPETVLRATTSRIADDGLRARFDASVQVLMSDGTKYDDAGLGARLSSLREADFPIGQLSTDDLKHHYDQRFARRGSPGRSYYDELMVSPEFGRCPYCGIGVVATLDHYLPKEHFPAISVLPTNLVPACRDCNHEKLRYKPSETNAALLHPYFDDIDSVVWLTAQVVEGEPPAVTFDVAQGIEATLRSRLVEHLRRFSLRTRFASHAGELIAELDQELPRLFRAVGSEGVAAHLLDLVALRSRSANNGWNLAVLRALAANEWYCQQHCSNLT